MLACLVTGRYRHALDDQPYVTASARSGWLRRLIAALRHRKA